MSTLKINVGLSKVFFIVEPGEGVSRRFLNVCACVCVNVCWGGGG